MAHDDRVALHVAEAVGVALHLRIEHLHGLVLRHRAGHHLGLGPLAVEDDLHLALGKLLSVGEQALGDDGLRPGGALHPGVPLGGVHALDLDGLQLHAGPLLQIDDGLGVEDALAVAAALAVVLLGVLHVGMPAHIKGVDAVVLAALVAVVMNAAAGDDVHVAVLAHEKVVVNHVGQAALGKDHRDVHLLPLGVGADADVDAGLVRLGDDLDELAVLPGLQLAVLPDVEGALGIALHVGDLVKQVGINGVHAPASSLTKVQADWVLARILGNSSSFGP